eukprot:2319746-Rhodomonas_salina.4
MRLSGTGMRAILFRAGLDLSAVPSPAASARVGGSGIHPGIRAGSVVLSVSRYEKHPRHRCTATTRLELTNLSPGGGARR